MSTKSSAGGPRGHARVSRKMPSRYSGKSVNGGEGAEVSRIAELYLGKLQQRQVVLAGLPMFGGDRANGLISGLRRLYRALRRLARRLLAAFLRRRQRVAFLRHGHLKRRAPCAINTASAIRGRRSVVASRACRCR